MKKILLIIYLVPVICLGQNHYDLCDQNEPIDQGWKSKKSLFIPTDIDKYVLLFEITNPTQETKRRQIATEYYDINTDNGYSKKWLVEKGYFSSYQDKGLKQFKKLFPRKYLVINPDTLDRFPKDEYPYMIRSYSEPIKMAGDNNWGWRSGYVIYDRRTDKTFPMIVGFKMKRLNWLFKNL
jgi:hypothetical protein